MLLSRHTRRREFITLLGSAAVAWPVAARAQQPRKLPTIGVLSPNTSSLDSRRVGAFVQRLGELGWIDGRNVTIEYRWVEGRTERLAEFAAEFVRLQVDVIVTSGTPPVVAAKQATSVIPIVFAAVGDPVGTDASVRRARTYSLARLCQSTRMISPDHKTASPQSRHLPRARSERPDRRAAEQRDERWRSFDHLIGERGYLG